MKYTISTQRAIANAAASLEMEGLSVSAHQKEWCRQFLNKEITKAEYLRRITEDAKGQHHAV